jgi:FkbM family methyltransferase
MLGMILFPIAASEGDRESAARNTLKLTYMVITIVGTVSLLLAFSAPVVIATLYGSEFGKAVTVLRFLLPAVVFLSGLLMINQHLAGLGYPVILMVSMLVGLGGNILLNYFLLPSLGVKGASIASSITYGLQLAIVWGYLLMSLKGKKLSNFTFTEWRRWALHGLRLYTRYSPIEEGKWLLHKVIRKYFEAPWQATVNSAYGTKFRLTFPEDHGWEYLYTLGKIETGTSRLCKRILRPGDVVFDIGANIGWYTCLFAKYVTCAGKVHAFEPVPWIFEKLRVNCALNGLTDTGSVFLNKLAIGENEGKMNLFTFKDLPHGETSAKIRDNLTVTSSVLVDVNSLDNYLRKIDNPIVSLVKVDIEGSEWSLLDGAKQFLNCRTPPMWIFEINFETAAAFGWSPYDLLDRLQNIGFRFFRIEGAWRKVLPMKSVKECQHGDNVLCFIPELHGDRLLHGGFALPS